MRKAIAENRNATILLTLASLQELKDKGFRFVQVRGVTVDMHYEYIIGEKSPERLI